MAQAHHMSAENLEQFRATNPAWRLLASNHAPLVASFLYAAFIVGNKRELSEHTLVLQWDEFLALYTTEEQTLTAKEQLTAWADNGWLRKFYPEHTDEIHYDLTPAADKAIQFLLGLEPKAFVGGDSKLFIFFNLLDDLIAKTNIDPKKRIAELKRARRALDTEIVAAKRGQFEQLSEVQIKERFYQASQTSREILSDFRVVEQNFRELDREMREKITSWTEGKSSLLTDFFDDNDKIISSEQGKSFSSFQAFLASKTIQDEFQQNIKDILALPPIRTLPDAHLLRTAQQNWLAGSAHVLATQASISAQLNRYVNDNFLQEERRIHQLIRQIEEKTIALRDTPPKKFTMTVDELTPDITLPTERPLFTAPTPLQIQSQDILEGVAIADDSALYAQVYVEKERLIKHIQQCLAEQSHVTLCEVLQQYPLSQGLAELVTYLAIAGKHNADFDFALQEVLSWEDSDRILHTATLPRITFFRQKEGSHG